MIKRTPISFVAVMFAVLPFITQMPAQGDTFGSGANTFSLDFVNIGDAGNATDTTGYGAVPYEYRIGKYEISQDAIDKATASGMANVTAGAWTGDQPAANISWYEAAAFVNWLNTNTGRQAAYQLTWDGLAWSMTLWSSADAWQLGGENLYRHKDAFYFLPSEDEWYKAAYYNPAGPNYFLYPTGSNVTPIAVLSGTEEGTAVYNEPFIPIVALVSEAGGLSPYGTMAQGGNVYEFMENSYVGIYEPLGDSRTLRGGDASNTAWNMRSTDSTYDAPDSYSMYHGFRVASVPEPSTYALLLMTAAGALWLSRRRRKN
jgi:formylglycine-generating enzyme required for sulfatase activity